MRLALISDLHGNRLALEAVLADIARVGVDRIVCLGDVATLGPHPEAVLERLEALGCSCIMGNHDEFLLDAGLIRSYTEAPIVVAAVDWCRAVLPAAALELVRGFARQIRVPLGDGGELLLFHGSPRSHMEDILATTPPEALDALLDGAHATVLAGGHTHIQMLRQHRGMLLVNPGSVGMPFRQHVAGRAPEILPHAEYAVVEGRGADVAVTLRRVGLDRAALRKQAGSVDFPLAPMLQQAYA
jgi:predicted phosphodiesterase